MAEQGQSGLIHFANCKSQFYVHGFYIVLSVRSHLVWQITRSGLHGGPKLRGIFPPALPLLLLA